MGSHKSSSTSVIIGAAVGGTVLLLLLLLAGVYAFRQKKRAETATKQSDPFGMFETQYALSSLVLYTRQF